ncbi:branched-chain amino acid transport system II carrier protein [Shouchella miscanthi]|uniref:Branched-chain amino acid transport system carrier protein n=3 Tax=Bacillaceae TaxID=186817 RepID=A0ABY7WBI1_9BACI|nr:MULTISPECIES: branched-chain amino acid transport system II carrier protein [Shouchella]MED4127753.1 branched-chain amino acid transport system II carrier protein [Shouchella miscanthi]WDF05215.1 branched-chain amino acid transport system II carrier protein [Shouchella hunanensis]
MMNQLSGISNKQTLYIGLMLFSLFFGAGNLIFPPELGQSAGSNAWPAIIGFLISGVGLPILGVMAITYVGSDDAEGLGRRVHPYFAIGFTALTFLTIGPFFAVPRTGTVSYEIGILPFIERSESLNASSPLWLFLFSVAYFAIVFYLSLSPGKFVDRIGKIITPFLLLVIAILLVTVLFNPLGTYLEPVDSSFNDYPFFRGITEGYLTMDTIAAVVFGIIVVKAIKDFGVTDQRIVKRTAWKAGIIAAICLGTVYAGLGYLGAISASAISADSGAGILASVSFEYFGLGGNILLGLIILAACIPTATGLISSCSIYFNKLFPSLSYKAFVIIFTLFSLGISNFGLSTIIEFSIPVLVFIYPIAIVLILLAFLEPLFKRRRIVYQMTVLFTAIVSINEGLMAANESWNFLRAVPLPFDDIGFAWALPALIGFVIGLLLSPVFKGSEPRD